MACATEGMGSTGKDRSTNRRFWEVVPIAKKQYPALKFFVFFALDPLIIYRYYHLVKEDCSHC